VKSGNAPSKRLRIGLVAAMAIALAALAAVYAVYRSKDGTAENLIENMPSGASLTIENLRHTAAREGAVDWQLNAARAQMAGNRKSAVLENVSVEFFADAGSIHLTADAGRLDLGANDLEVSGNVVVRNDDYRIVTERLQYRQTDRMLVADAPVKITGKAVSLTADTAAFDLENRNLRFEGNVYGTITEHLPL
jgi:LPS export ABC transporter protein LptC